jgi:hypothetical protein
LINVSEHDLFNNRCNERQDGATMNKGRIKPNGAMTDNFREAVRKTGQNNLQIALRLGLTVYQVNNIMDGNFDVEHRVVKEFCKEYDVDTSEIVVLPEVS